MKLLKKINNNYALAKDSYGQTIIVEGKGIGFVKMPCELTDLSKITRTYYGISQQHIDLIKKVNQEILDISNQIYEQCLKSLNKELNQNLPFILADHIEFAIERNKKGINIKMPISYEIENLYKTESKIAAYAISLIRSILHISLPIEEKTGIALTIINAENSADFHEMSDGTMVSQCTKIIEKEMKITINRNSINYSRFVYHMECLFQRSNQQLQVSLETLDLYGIVKSELSYLEKCINELIKYLEENKIKLNEEEKLYLMLHINRLCDREDCHR